MSRKQAAVVVLGDVGRSPRMGYHAHSLAQNGYDVFFVGFMETTPHPAIHNNPHIKFVPLFSVDAYLSKLPGIISFPLKFMAMFYCLLFQLLFSTSWSLDLILVQNPPAAPTMLVCWLVSLIKGANFIIDWHNYMFSILSDRYGLTHLYFPTEKTEPFSSPKQFLKRAYIYAIYIWEGFFGQLADSSFCVTNALKEDLQQKWDVQATVLYDRPAKFKFKPATDVDKQGVLMKLEHEHGPALNVDSTKNDNRVTKLDNGKVIFKEDRPLIVVSSTSWTPDEDFSILLDALCLYEQTCNKSTEKLPNLLVIITGKGPQKNYYMDKIKHLNLKHINILTPWLEAADYPIILQTADIGVSLHMSTSGLDLPMKVVDMFGAGLPVLAKNFNCIDELVKDGHNGYLFDDVTDLHDKLCFLAKGFPAKAQDLEKLSNYLNNNKMKFWEDQWPEITKNARTNLDLLAKQRIQASTSSSTHEHDD